MKKNLIAGVLVVVAVVALASLYLLQAGQKKVSSGTVEPTGDPAVTITRTNEGYEPAHVTIKKGDIVLWKNDSKDYHWPASDLHPTHGVYPEFDPLRPIAPGDTWKFKFDKVGKWNFHDHIRANKVGTVTVTE